MNLVQKAISWLNVKANGFPVWNAAGPWPRSVVAEFGEGGALQLATVYGCIRVRAQTLGSLPFHVYQEDSTGERTKAVNHWLYPLLHDRPNAYQTSMEFRECMERSFCLTGNAYAEIKKLGNRVVSLNFLPPSTVSVRWDMQKGLIYHYSYFGQSYDLAPEQVLHVKNFSSNGLWGDSPIRCHAINHALEAQNYGRNFLQNLGRPSGFLKMKNARPNSDQAVDKMRDDWQAIYGGPDNAGKTAITWNDCEYVPLSVPNDEAQYIETRNFSIEEIAGGIYGVPLNLIGHTDKTATYASAEHFDIAYVKHTVRPQSVRYEQSINKALLSKEPNVYCEMDLDGLLRGDSAAQASFYGTVRANAGMTSNEFRRKMNWPRSAEPGADELMQQSNMIPLSMAGKITSVSQSSDSLQNIPPQSGVKPTPDVQPVPGVKP